VLGFSHDEIDRKFDAIAAFADIGDHLDQPVKTYSSGMLVRLAFAVQVQVEPDILIVDEALAVGDALFQKRCFQRIEKLVSDGMSLLFVSHDQESIRTLTNRCVLLSNGRQLDWGTSSNVVLHYRRLLHDEEAAYFSGLAEKLKSEAQPEPVPVAETAKAPAPTMAGSDRLTFGDGGVRIVSVASSVSRPTVLMAAKPRFSIPGSGCASRWCANHRSPAASCAWACASVTRRG
jgi:lipopolysaccharide transport system ATP-binding protein